MKLLTAAWPSSTLVLAALLVACGAPTSVSEVAATSAALEQCGSGLYCQWGPLTGGSACLISAGTIYCCPAGQIIDSGTCVTQTCSTVNDLTSCNAAGCAWYACANACRVKGSDLCTVCPGYSGCGGSCDSITTLDACDNSGCAWNA